VVADQDEKAVSRINSKLVSVAVGVLVAAGTASVQAQSKTREEVRGEAASAAKAGQIDRGEVTTVPPVRSTKVRTDVKSETRAAVKAGQIDHGEVTTVPKPQPSGKTRAEVKAEAASAIRGRPLGRVDDPKATPAERPVKPKADDAGSKR
jgi:hypothetical protein